MFNKAKLNNHQIELVREMTALYEKLLEFKDTLSPGQIVSISTEIREIKHELGIFRKN